MSLVSGDSPLIVCWPCWAMKLFMPKLFVFRTLIMTCQSSLLIAGLNELCLSVCTPQSDFQLPRHLQLIWLHAKHTSLPYFSASLSGSVEGWRQTIVFNSILFYIFISVVLLVFRSLLWSLCVLNQNIAKKKNYLFSKWSLSSRKETPKYKPLYRCRRWYASLFFNTTQY